jgi:hypothetical protein
MQQLRQIPVSDLRPGLTVWTEIHDRFGIGYTPDVYLADYFLSNSYTPREFINGRRLQFKTGSGSQVVWRNCGTVVVSVGHAKKEIIRKVNQNG